MGAQTEMARALTILAEGRMPDIAKPLTGMGSGVMELALKHRGDAFRVVYAPTNRHRHLGHPCVPEEIKVRDQNAKAGD